MSDGLCLLPQHAALIAASSITPEVAEARGYRSIVSVAQAEADLRPLGFGPSQRRASGLLIPIRTVHGTVGLHQYRPDAPRIVKGRVVKYETASGARLVLDVPPTVRPLLGDPAVPLAITEGARKVDSAVSAGLACVGVLGVWGWRGRNERGGRTALPCWEAVALNGRRVFLAFDDDVMVKASVRLALDRLAGFLLSRGASVRYIIPTLPEGIS